MGFLNQNENKGMRSSKSKSWNKRNNKKNMRRAKQKFNKIILQKRNKTRLWQKNIPKIDVEYTKGDGEFYFYLYPLGT